MKSNLKKICAIITVSCVLMCMNTVIFAHSGKTDDNGGHKDNKNVSGLGNYHYHCGGNPPHLHTNGVCPYASGSSFYTTTSSTETSSSKTSTSKSSVEKTNEKSTVEEPKIVKVTGIKINENLTSIKAGENMKLTATLSPTNATNKDVTWKSSDESVATVTSTGEITAKKGGTVEIKAISSDEKESTIKIMVEEVKEEVNNVKEETNDNNVVNTNSNTAGNSNTDSDPTGGILGLGLIGGGIFLGYKKYKKSRQ